MGETCPTCTSVCLSQGDSTSANDLKIKFSVNGICTDPACVFYTLIDATTCDENGNSIDLVIGKPEKLPIKQAIGCYWAPWTVPLNEPTGLHKIRWTYKETADSPFRSIVQEFTVVGRQICLAPGFEECEYEMIRKLRAKLRDINPDRDYSFSPPESEKVIAGFTEVRGFRWPDEQLYDHLIDAVDYVNIHPPLTGFSLCNLPGTWRSIVLVQAQVFALLDLATLWIGEEFDYSLNGISLTIDRYSKYSGLASQIQGMSEKAIEAGKKTVKIIKGLAQSRFTFARGAALGPHSISYNTLVEVITPEKRFLNIQIGVLYDLWNNLCEDYRSKFSCRSVDLLTGEIEIKKLLDVVKHDTRKREIFRITTERGETELTSDHCMYVFGSIPIKTIPTDLISKDLSLVAVKDNKIVPSKVLKIERVDDREEMFDLSVEDNHNFFLSNGELTKNTGGQSLRRWFGNTSFGANRGAHF